MPARPTGCTADVSFDSGITFIAYKASTAGLRQACNACLQGAVQSSPATASDELTAGHEHAAGHAAGHAARHASPHEPQLGSSLPPAAAAAGSPSTSDLAALKRDAEEKALKAFLAAAALGLPYHPPQGGYLQAEVHAPRWMQHAGIRLLRRA
jgi:hypothetical protein